MSIRVMSRVWEMDLPAKDKLVLLALADCANDEGLAWPSIATLARKCGCDQRTVQRNLRDLEKRGLFTREEVNGKGCRYIFDPRHIVTPGKMSPATKTTETPGKSPPKPSRTVNGLANAKPKRAKKSVSDFVVPAWVPAEPWAAYLEMRKDKGAWPTPKAVGMLIADLEGWRAKGHDPGAILNNSTKSNWTGLFEPKDKQNGQRSQFSRPTTRQLGERAAARLSGASDGAPDGLPRLGAPGGHG